MILFDLEKKVGAIFSCNQFFCNAIYHLV